MKKQITTNDFRENELLYAIAKHDLNLAIKIAQEFGGDMVYIVKWDTITGRKDRDIRNNYIVSQKRKMAGNRTLAKELNLSVQSIRSLYKSNS